MSDLRTNGWDTVTVQLAVRLPRDIAAQAEEVQASDPDFLSRIVLYGLTRRSIYQHLREGEQRFRDEGVRCTCPDGGAASWCPLHGDAEHRVERRPLTPHEIAILEENEVRLYAQPRAIPQADGEP